MNRRLSLAGQLLALQVVIVCVVLVGVAAVSVAQSTQRAEEVQGRRALEIAETLANSRATRTALELGRIEYLRNAAEDTRTTSGSADVVVAQADRTVLASADPGLLGRPLDLGASRVLEGRSWVGDVDFRDGVFERDCAVVDHLIRPQPAGELQIAFGRGRDHVRAEPAGQLYRE